ncbi:MAG TPA: methyltransferase domain-containing protein [Pyrinomonadaceae bacterium]|nr:methyltransferase domain-containing protein [Pyrinomonadaceae bacterium]
MIYGAVNQPVLVRLPRTATRVLDVGCGTGALGRAIKGEFNCELVGVTYSEAEAESAAAHLDRVLVCDLNDFEPEGLGEFDCVVCSHVLEHLYKPERLLKLLRRSLSSGGILVVALPNVLHWRQRLEFLRGKFRYEDGGLMDRTHYRFYDWTTARALLTESGYAVLEGDACGGFPLSRYILKFGPWLDRAALRLSPGAFGTQFIFVCRPEPA